MMIRLFHARVRPGKQAEFKRVLEMLAVPATRARQGMLAFYPGQPLGVKGDEFVLVTIWKDTKDLDAFTPDDWAKKIVPEEALPLLAEWRVSGYKSFGALEPPLQPLFQNL